MSSREAASESTRLPLSVAIVCRNNERTIGRTLASVHDLATQIIAIDSGSTDGTINLLEHHDAEVIRHEWLGHIRTKQFALDHCTQEWVLCLDSDESVEPELRDEIVRVVRQNSSACAGYEVNRKVWWDGAFLNYAWQPEWRLRLVRRGRAAWGGYDPHDKLEITGSGSSRVERLKGDLRHESFFTMQEHLAQQVAHARVAARSYQRLGRKGRVTKLITSPIGAWLKQMVIKQAWRDGWRGWSAASATAAAALMKHMVLLELTRPRGDSHSQMTSPSDGVRQAAPTDDVKELIR